VITEANRTNVQIGRTAPYTNLPLAVFLRLFQAYLPGVGPFLPLRQGNHTLLSENF